ncbi:MAG TPA: ABC transporter ATP-binding protein [Isosphaeraceae bacterium]|jgi:ABC-2 type transport system ATP-binding protein
MLEVVGLVKRYGPLVAVDGVSFSVAAGETVGLLGPNGAGKTTTVAMIAGLVTPDAGEVRIGGRPLKGDADPLKRRLGLVPQELALYEELSAMANLRFFGGLYVLSGPELDAAIERVLALVGLAERGRDLVKTFSGGMKRRLNLAASLLHDPAVLLLDEPTVGVDPQSRNAIFDNLESLRGEGKALVYTTHYMEEAERLCDRLVIIDKGRVVASDTMRGLSSRAPSANRIWVELEELVEGPWLAEVRGLPGVLGANAEGGRLAVDVADLGVAPAVLASVAGSDRKVTHFVSERADLESVFLNLTGRSLRDP